MGDHPDQTPADSTGPQPARPRPAASGRPRPASRTGTRGPGANRVAAAPRAARARPPARSRASAPRAATATAETEASPPARTRPPAGPRRPAPSPDRRRKGLSQNTTVVLLSVLTVVVVSLIVYAFVLSPAASVSPNAGGATTSTTVNPDAPGTTLADSAFTTYTSPEMGFSMKFPTAWTASKADSGELIVEATDNDLVSARLFTRTEVPTTAENLANVKAVTDGIVGTNKSAVILKVQPILVNGMPGYYYLYTFTEAETGATGAHAHYFLFRGRNMYTIVFQALPQEGFTGLSKVFDQMAESFQTVPDTGPTPESTPTTVG